MRYEGIRTTFKADIEGQALIHDWADFISWVGDQIHDHQPFRVWEYDPKMGQYLSRQPNELVTHTDRPIRLSYGGVVVVLQPLSQK